MLDPLSPEFRQMPPILQLLRVVEALRAPDGCPWDRRQTHASMARYLLEESHEVLETIDRGDTGRLREELGDLLLQIVFHAELAREQGAFAFEDVCRSIVAKMIRRHPHVFGEERADASEVLARWEESKKDEGGHSRESLMDGIPTALPALLQAERVQGRAAESGFEWPHADSAWAKVREELFEFETAFASEGQERQEAELGDLLFALAAFARMLGLDSEAAARKAVARFVRRFRSLELRFGGDLRGVGPEEMIREWRALSG